METQIIRIDQNIIDKYNPDRFAVQRILKELRADYEYLVEGKWRKGPLKSKPERRRIVFEGNPFARGIDRFRIARETYFAWRSLTEASVYEPVRKEAIIERLVEPQGFRILAPAFPGLEWSGMKSRVTLFVPWGVRPQGQFGESEIAVMDRIRSVQDGLKARRITTAVLLMPADVYATEVNRQVGRRQTQEYFMRATDAAEERGFEVKPWSEIRGETWGYENRAEELTPDALREMLPPQVIEEAKGAARRRSGYVFDTDVDNAAFRYLRERVCEAELIEQKYKPIKVSAVAKNKDNYVDRDLPRLYVMPQELQFPWLK